MTTLRRVHCLIAISLLILAITGCGTPKPVNPHPTPYDKPAEILNDVIASTNSAEALFRNHHDSKRANLLAQVKTIKANTNITKDARKAQLASVQQQLNAETDRFAKFNKLYKEALKSENEAAGIIKTLAESGGSAQTATDKVKAISKIVVDELLANIVDDPELQSSLRSLNTLIQQLISSLGGK